MSTVTHGEIMTIFCDSRIKNESFNEVALQGEPPNRQESIRTFVARVREAVEETAIMPPPEWQGDTPEAVHVIEVVYIPEGLEHTFHAGPFSCPHNPGLVPA